MGVNFVTWGGKRRNSQLRMVPRPGAIAFPERLELIVQGLGRAGAYCVTCPY
jgi:hypothetical protein